MDRHRQLLKLASSLVDAIVSKPVKDVPVGFPMLQVKDPIRAIMELGLAARARYTGDVIAIVGAVGVDFRQEDTLL